MTGMYMTEIAPSRIRGFLLIFYSAWYGIGQLCASLALKVSNDRRPMEYLTPIYTEWAMMVSFSFYHMITINVNIVTRVDTKANTLVLGNHAGCLPHHP